MLLQLWLLPFRFLTLIREFIHRNKDRTFVGSKLKITPGGIWKKAPDLPSYRYEFGAAVVGDKIFVIGGVYAPSLYHVTKRNEVYDVKKHKWQSKASYPVIIHHPGVTSDGHQVYVAGGCGLRIFSYKLIHAYDPKSDSWVRLADMSTKRCALGLAYQDGKIYAVGGADNKRPLSIFEEYDIKENKWRRLKNMPTKREHLFAVAAFGKVYAIGGYQNDRFHNVNTFEAYDIKKKTWKKLPPVPAKISGFSACVWRKSIFVFGGEQAWSVSGEVYEYQIDKNKWLRRSDLAEARYAGTVTPAGDGIHIIGGNTRMFTHLFSATHDVFIP